MGVQLELPSWSDFKAICIFTKRLICQYADLPDRYDVYGPDSREILWHAVVLKDGGSDQTDFEGNYKAGFNFSLDPSAGIIGRGVIQDQNGLIVVPTQGVGTLNFYLNGTWEGDLVLEATQDGQNWFSINGNGSTAQNVISSTTSNQVITVPVILYVSVRLRADTWNSGIAQVAYLLENEVPTSGVGTGNSSPAPFNSISQPPTGTSANIAIDTAQNISTRGQVLTDEGSFREDFPGTSLFHPVTGTVTLTQGSNLIQGSGTSFTTELNRERYIRIVGQSEETLSLVSTVIDDEQALLVDSYSGETLTGNAEWSRWDTCTGAGATISLSGGYLELQTGTESSTVTQVYKVGDFAPLVLTFSVTLSQRIANQEIIIGFVDDTDSISQQAVVAFNGTNANQVVFRTSSDSTATEIQQTTVSLPSNSLTSNQQVFSICIQADKCILAWNNAALATHRLHIPDPYAVIMPIIQATNSATVTSTTVSIDTIFFSDQDQVQVGSSFTGDTVPVQFPVSSQTNISRIGVTTNNTTLLSNNINRKGVILYNDSNTMAYIKFGVAASTTSYTMQMASNSYLSLNGTPIYTGQIDCIWTGIGLTGGMQITEMI